MTERPMLALFVLPNTPGERIASMTDKEFEDYCFYRLYSIDFNSARNSVRLVRRYRRKDIRYCVLSEVTVTYARPFSANRGRLWRSHRLPETIVPGKFQTLHAELMKLRNEAFAHTDLGFRRPRLARWATKSRPIYPMSFANPDFAALDHRVDDVEQLVMAVESVVNAWAKAFEERFEVGDWSPRAGSSR